MSNTCHMSMTYEDTKIVGKSLNEKNDCAVRALTIVSDWHYSYVHAMFAHFGRQHRKQTCIIIIFKVLRELEIFVVDVTANFKAKTVRTLARELPEADRFLIWTSGHMLAYRDGKICDFTEGRLNRIVMIMKVTF